MNIIRKKIFYLCFEIMCIGSAVLLTNNFWQTLNMDEAASTAYLYTNENSLNITYNEQNYNNEKIVYIKVINSGAEIKKYNLYIKIDEENLDTNNSYIKINEKNYELNNFKNYTEDKYTYYLIDTQKIEKSSINDLFIKTNLYNIDFKLEEA